MSELLVVDASGQAALIDLDTGERTRVGAGPPPRRPTPVLTAAWSPAGEWAAVAVASVEPGGPQELLVHDRHAPTARVLAAQLTAFYLCPSPSGRFLSHLSPGPLGLELGVSEVASGELTIIERGQPLFWAWSADSTRLAVHVADRLYQVALDEPSRPATLLAEDLGSFIAPWWALDGSIAAVRDDRIVGIGPDGSATPLTDGPGPGRFALDPDGRRLAHIDIDDDSVALVCTDLLTGERSVIGSERTAAFFWSPDGRRLASLVMARPGVVQWLVWDGETTVRTAPFRPTSSWGRQVLPFFEQYSQSHSVWSADGEWLVAPSLDADGSSEAVAQRADGSPGDRRISGARLVWWAPGPPSVARD
ncbi:MAG: hypothetical protein OEY23_05575 [Acidimicrobiia bacterium]|nr:hypothetical protein [Acidimicrobiia bacterium]